MIRLRSVSLSDDTAKLGAWIKAYKSWKALAAFSENSSAPQPSELLNAQANARDIIKSYEKPSGIWQRTENNYTHYFVVDESPAGLFKLYMKDSPKIDLTSTAPLPQLEYVELKEISSSSCELLSGNVCMTLVGHSGGQVYEGCICDVDYTATLSRGYTVLSLGGRIRKVYGPDTYSCPALRNWGPVDRVFEYLSRVQ